MNSEPASAPRAKRAHGKSTDLSDATYRLDDQIGYLLRLANQRHLEIFNRLMPDLTPTQFAVLARLNEMGPLSQNELGRQVAMDAATTNGVVERLNKKGLIKIAADTKDRRRLKISLSPNGQKTTTQAIEIAARISAETSDCLTVAESSQLVRLLIKLQDQR